MTARKKNNFNCHLIAQLVRQLQFSPPDKRIGQIHRAEKLHDEIDPSANYPFDYIAYRITQYRRDSNENILLVGQAAVADLRLLIDSLSKSIDLPLDDEPTETIDQIAKRFKVNPKTIERWRKAGLRWRWVQIEDKKRKYIGITQKAIEKFTLENPRRLSRASTFSQIEKPNRQKLLDKAKELSNNGKTLNQAAVNLAKENNRAVETIRQILKSHDKNNPQEKIFTQHRAPINDHEKRVIHRAFQWGISLDKLCNRFSCSPTTIYRAVNKVRADKAMNKKISWIFSPTFTRKDADEVFLRKNTLPETDSENESPKISLDNLPKPLKQVYNQEAIAEKQKRSLFLRYNYLKFKASKTREEFGQYEVRKRDLEKFEKYLQQAKKLRSFLVRLGLPLILSVSRRHQMNATRNSINHLLLLLETGFDELIKSVEKYNGNLSQEFDSFVTNRLLGRFARESDKQNKDNLALKRITGEKALKRMQNMAKKADIELLYEKNNSKYPSMTE